MTMLSILCDFCLVVAGFRAIIMSLVDLEWLISYAGGYIAVGENVSF